MDTWRWWICAATTLVLVGSCSCAVVNVGILESDVDGDNIDNAFTQAGANPSNINIEIIPESLQEQALDRVNEYKRSLADKSIHCMTGSYHDDVAMAAENLGIFYISTSFWRVTGNDLSLHLLPKPADLTEPMLEVTRRYRWQTTAVIYEQTLDYAVIKTFVESRRDLKFWNLGHTVTLEKIRECLLDMREKEISHFVVLTRAVVTKMVFTQARRLGIIANPFAWIVLNLGADDFVHGILDDLKTNVTMVDFVSDDSVVLSHPNFLNHSQLGGALMIDAFTAIKNAIGSNQPLGVDVLRRQMAQSLKQVTFTGQTGLVRFDSTGHRINYMVKIDMYDGVKIKNIGSWDTGPAVPVLRLDTIPDRNYTHMTPLHGKKAKVVTILEKPFTMIRKECEKCVGRAGKVKGCEDCQGNGMLEGFTVDMMQEISAMVGFEYELYLVHDGKFGARTSNGEWNGMIGEILAGNATMSMAPLSINAAREKVVDFTKPFKTRHIKALISTPESSQGYFQFMNPLSDEVWACILVAMVVASFILFGLEKYGMAVNKTMPRLNGGESCWFIFGSLVGGGSETSPVTIAGRVFTSAWWFFALILTSTYTANLAAFLTVKKINTPVSSVAELMEQSKIAYGTVRNSGVMGFMRNTEIEPYHKMWTRMSEVNPEWMVNTTEEGLRRVREGNYAFLWDSTVTSYVAAEDCTIMEIGPQFDPKGFGMAVPPGAIYLEELSLAILKLGDNGKILTFENRWWPPSECPDETKGSVDETTELTLDNVAGLFIVLIAGVVFALLALAFDRYMKSWRKSRKKQSPVAPVDKPAVAEAGNHRYPENTYMDMLRRDT